MFRPRFVNLQVTLLCSEVARKCSEIIFPVFAISVLNQLTKLTITFFFCL